MLLFTALAGFIYDHLLPGGRVSATARAVASVLSVAAVCVPLFGFFSNADNDLAFSGLNGESGAYEPYSYYADIAVKTVEDRITNIVRAYTDNSFFIETDVNIRDDMCIDIKQVSVIFEKYPDGLEELSLAIENELGIAPVFALKEDENE